MPYYEIVPTKIFRAGAETLTYESPKPLEIGTLVLIEIGKRPLPGLILKTVKKPPFPTKPVSKILYATSLPPHLIKALLWLSEYYLTPLPLVLATALPTGIEKERKTRSSIGHSSDPLPALPNPTPAQKTALAEIRKNPNKTLLLHGITGSGKTLIYMHLAKESLLHNKSVILLVPEIALTSQLVANFEQHFPNITLLHSKQTESERHVLWTKTLETKTPQIIIGPRSALFAPVHNLGLIIIDEAHEPAYRQDQNPKYSALRLASLISPKTVFGTATPLITDYFLAHQKSAIINLTETAIKSDKTAKINIIDLKNRDNFHKHRLFSDPLITALENSIKSRTLSLIFHNRRGSAPMTICDHCGWQALCPTCFLPMTLHADLFALLCHTCGRRAKVPTSCPECKNPNIMHKGVGTKLLEAELTRLFPEAKIARFDADTETAKTLEKLYLSIKNGAYDIIIGTQMLAKGFDFPNLTTLGVVQADAGLSLPDFSSEERTYELLTQVIGRATRGHQNTNIIIQTYQPDHPIIKYATENDYASLYRHVLAARHKATLPPYSYLAALTLTYKTEQACVANIKKLHSDISANLFSAPVFPPVKTTTVPCRDFEQACGACLPLPKSDKTKCCGFDLRERKTEAENSVCGNIEKKLPEVPASTPHSARGKLVAQVSLPTPAFHERTNQGYSWQIVLKSPSRSALLNAIKSLPPNPHLHISLDPYTLL
jgi:primosomal protein N' (replication factor Y)